MSSYYKVAGTHEVVASETEALQKAIDYYSQGKIPIKCTGKLAFEDFRTANYHYNKIVYQNPASIFYVDAENETSSLYFDVSVQNNHTLVFDFHRFFLRSLAAENLALIKEIFGHSIYGSILFKTGSSNTNPSTFENTNSFKKDKPDNIKEVKIRGEANFKTLIEAKENYVFLALQLPNTIFYPPSEIFSNIRLEGCKIIFDCHRFVEETLIEENRAAIEKILRLADSGYTYTEEELTENVICMYTMQRTLGGFKMSDHECWRVQEEPE